MGMMDTVRGLWRRSEPLVPGLDPGLLPARREAAHQDTAARREAISLTLPGAMSLDADDYQFRRITTGGKFQRRDLSPLAQDRMLEIVWYLWEQNPFARRLVTLMTDLVVGEGVTVEAKDERIQEVIDATWNHRVNQLRTRLREFHNGLSLNGELVLPASVNPVNGVVQLGYVDPYQLKDVIPLPDNVLVPDYVLMKPNAQKGERDGQKLKIIRQNPTTGLLEGEAFYFAVNKLPNSLRGRSDLMAVADWLDLYDQYMFGEVERLTLLSNFVWDYQITGATNDDEIKAKMKKLGKPTPGMVFGHNEKETLNARTPDLKATDRSEVARLLRTHIAGSMGFPLSYLGEVDSNRATIEGQNDIMLKTPSARQKELKELIATVVQFGVEQATTLNPALFRDMTAGFEVRMPEIAAKDVARVGSVLVAVTQAMDTAMANGTASRKLAVTVQAAVISHLGVETNPQQVMDDVDKEAEKRASDDDERQADLARNRATNPNPPVPADEDPDAADEDLDAVA